MKITLSHYRNCFPAIERFVNNHKDLSANELVNRSNGMTSAPLIVCAYFIKELIPDNTELDDIIQSLMEFYKYDSVGE